MKKTQRRHTIRIRNLVITLVLTALILSVSTYAWFIGMRTVNVSQFSVDIAVAKDLELSLNGVDWGDTVTINAENFNDTVGTVYEGNTNWWTGQDKEGNQNGLVPMSSIGNIDSDKARLILFEKSSVTASKGGYRIMTSRAENEGADEAVGYVAFDLFVKNHSGADYIKELEILNEEAIYLDTASAVTVAETGGVSNTGIENSVRVAFAQIGRVKENTADVTVVTGINCTTAASVTGICTRPAQIWEPNDLDHVQGAISQYSTACRKRTDKTTFAEEDCSPIVDGTYYPTNAIGGPIGSASAVDVYDGINYNGYVGSISATRDAENMLLFPYPYFTDTMKDLKGMARPEFMFLAPNSITKVRIYIYIEGQDVDNYDLAAIGKAISVKFGFTKQRFTAEEIPGAPTTTPTTTTAP